jgi:hypothetical protein
MFINAFTGSTCKVTEALPGETVTVFAQPNADDDVGLPSGEETENALDGALPRYATCAPAPIIPDDPLPETGIHPTRAPNDDDVADAESGRARVENRARESVVS